MISEITELSNKKRINLLWTIPQLEKMNSQQLKYIYDRLVLYKRKRPRQKTLRRLLYKRKRYSRRRGNSKIK